MRTGCSVVAIDRAGNIKCAGVGTMWWTENDSGAAEVMAVAKALHKAVPPLVILTDYEGVLKRLWDRPRTEARFARIWND